MGKLTTAELSDHTMAVLLSQEVATLTTKLETAEGSYESEVKILDGIIDGLEQTITALEAEITEFEKCAKHDIRRYMDINKGLLNDMPCPACELRELLKQEQEL